MICCVLIPTLLLAIPLFIFYFFGPVPQRNLLYTNSTKFSFPSSSKMSYWMKHLNDSEEISTLSLPGTHDSGTYDCHFFQVCKSSQCQSWNITIQLQAGIRFLDLRVRKEGGTMYLIHGMITFRPLQEIFEQISHFMRKHPSQFLILSFNGDTSKHLGTYILDALAHNKISYVLSTDMPRVKDLRGKAWIFQNFGVSFNPKTYQPVGSNSIEDKDVGYVQGHYIIDRDFTLKNKVQEVLIGAFDVSISFNKQDMQKSRMKINSLNAVGPPDWTSIIFGPFPYEIAINQYGPNSVLYKYLLMNQIVILGLTIMDFPGNGLIQRIVKANNFVKNPHF